MEKVLKLKVRKFWGLTPTSVEVTGEKLVEGWGWGAFRPPILNRVKNSCFKQGSQFRSACFPSGLIYYGPENWSFRRQIPYANYFIIFIYYKAFLYFFRNQFFKKYIYIFFAFWRKKMRRHLVEGVLL